MVQVLPQIQQEPSFGREFGRALGVSVGEGAAGIMDTKAQMIKLAKESKDEGEFLQRLTGKDWSGASPEMRKEAVKSFLTGERSEIPEMNLETIRKRFGPKNAELYRTATTQGRSHLMKYFLENEQREQGFDKDLGDEDFIEMPEDDQLSGQAGIQPTEERPIKQESDFKYPKLPRRPMTVKEEIKLQGEREKSNSPIYKETADKVFSLEQDYNDIQTLRNLDDTGQLVEGAGRITIDQKTGDLFFPATESPETQAYYKTLQRFVQKAKDFFPGRVTNFDLESFKAGLPGLSNTREGRQLIYKQMELANEMNTLNEKALQDVFDHYGVENISYPQAKKIANSIIKEKKKLLSDRMKTIDGEIKKMQLARESKKASKGFVKMRSPEGDEWEIPLGKDFKEARDAKWTIVK